MRTRYGTELPDQLLCHYLDTLVAQFYKILPMRESEEPTVKEFMSSLQVELIGVKGVIESLDYDERYLKLDVYKRQQVKEVRADGKENHRSEGKSQTGQSNF